MRRDHPNLPNVVHGGSPHNPMGVAAMSLAGGEYAIHGTNQPGSIGHFVSYGCIRMYNEDITDLLQPRQRRHPGGGSVIGEVSGTPDALTGDGSGIRSSPRA